MYHTFPKWTFKILLHAIDVRVGISLAIVTTSPSYSVEVCVGIIAGALQPGVTVTITVTVAVQQTG